MLAKKCEEEELLTFSRHTNVQQLRRYLGFGAIAHAAQKRAVEKAAVLAGLEGGHSNEVRVNDWLSVTPDGDIVFAPERAPATTVKSDLDRSGYGLHSKAATRVPIDLDAVDRMAMSCSATVRDDWFEARRFLSDIGGFHSSVPWTGKVRASKLTPAQIGKMLENNNIAEIPDEGRDKVRGTINVFLVPEDNKSRWRVIKDPVDFNAHYGREYLPATINATKHSARSAIFDGDGAIAIDLAAFFDQILLDDDVTYCQAFKAAGKLLRNLRLPMGSRFSSAIGTALLRVLLDFDLRGVRVDWCVDSARFVGKKEAVVDAAFRFVQRCKEVGASANELDCSTASREDVAKLWNVHDADYVGECLDFQHKTIRCRAKHIEKLQSLFVACLQARCTYAQLFSLLGMLYYCSDTLGLRIDRRLETRLYFSTLARHLARDVTLWDTPAPTRPPMRDLSAWFAQAVENRPAKVERLPPPDTVIFGDACGIGYAGIICHRRADGQFDVQLMQRRWSESERSGRGFDHSTASEPEAAVRLLDAASRVFPGSTAVCH
jgi:hypothetical protein